MSEEDDSPIYASPAATYLLSLNTEVSRNSMRWSLFRIVQAIAPTELEACCQYLEAQGRPKFDSIFYFNWHLLRYTDTARLRAYLITHYTPSTINHILCGLRRVLKEAWRLDLMSVEDYRRAADVQNVSFHQELSGRTLSDQEIASLLLQCEADEIGLRDAAIISLFFSCGLRIAELQALNLDDYIASESALRVMGKGLKERIVYIPSLTEQRLQDWITMRGSEPGALFIAIGRYKRCFQQRQRCSIRAISGMLQRRGRLAGVEAFSPHDLRRTTVTNLLAKGVDVITVSRCAGHKSPQSTLRYDRRSEQVKRQAVQLRPFDES